MSRRKKVQPKNRRSGLKRIGERVLGKPDNISLEELEQRKRRLEAELVQIQHELDESVNGVREKVIASVVPKAAIRKQPFRSVAIAMTAGFIIGLPKLRGRKQRRRSSVSGENGMSSLVADELKRYATRRAVTWLMHSIDDQLTERFFPGKKRGEKHS